MTVINKLSDNISILIVQSISLLEKKSSIIIFYITESSIYQGTSTTDPSMCLSTVALVNPSNVLNPVQDMQQTKTYPDYTAGWQALTDEDRAR